MKSVGIFILAVPGRFRGESLVAALKGLNYPITVIYGLDGSKEEFFLSDFERDRSMRLYGRELLATEIACTLGHEKILREFSKSKLDLALILEDDVVISSLAYVEKVINQFKFASPAICTFSITRSFRLNIGSKKKANGELIFRNYCLPTFAGGFIINKIGALAVLRAAAKFGVRGFQADFPLYYGDVLDIYFTHTSIIDIKEDDESLIGDRSFSIANKSFMQLASEALLLDWILRGKKDSGLKGYFMFRHGRFVQTFLKKYIFDF